mmetsp:Transcript_17755/g.19930  ORF Transcript_17755/g.19930 Transcript_17755/m.19930 type:complete len:119 (+) Transcript_17755:36-392(+)
MSWADWLAQAGPVAGDAGIFGKAGGAQWAAAGNAVGVAPLGIGKGAPDTHMKMNSVDFDSDVGITVTVYRNKAKAGWGCVVAETNNTICVVVHTDKGNSAGAVAGCGALAKALKVANQ